MRPYQTSVFLALFLLGIGSTAFAQSSVLSSGMWYKLSVKSDGVYKISHSLLKKMGVDPSKIDPRKIKIYGNPGGMLPQSNSAERISDLLQNAVYVEGESDGKFDKSDFILFFAEGPDKVRYDLNRGIYSYENNLYSDENFYFLTIGADNGKRVTQVQSSGTGFPSIRQFKDYIVHELDTHNELFSGREWYGEKFGLNNSQFEFSFSLNGIRNSSMIQFVTDVVGQTYTSGKVKIFVNDVSIAEQNVIAIPQTQYGSKGVHLRDTLVFTGADIAAQGKSSLKIQYQYEKGPNFSQAYLDYFLLTIDRELALYNNQTIFVSPESTLNSSSQFEIANATEQTQVWDITDAVDAKLQTFSLVNGTATFSTTTDELKRFVVFKNAEAPTFVEKVSNQNLHDFVTPNLIIVTHPDFKPEADRLAAHRTSFNNWTVHVVTTDQIYNEFSGGKQDVSAIRDFVKHLYDKNPAALKALLLFGKCSYDFKNRVAENTNFVITYESRNSLLPLETYSSDDYFGFLDDNEGQWLERPQPQNHTLEIGVGRLPVKSLEESRHVVDKIIAYDTSTSTLGYWRKQIVFVADDGNNVDGFSELHQRQANDLAELIEVKDPAFDAKKLFMGSYVKSLKGSTEEVPEMTADIIRSFDRGSVIINFTGHGSERQWADENIFNNTTIRDLENDRYPFLVTATCEFGRHDHPREISGAERSVILNNGGAIGLVTTARPVNASTNFTLNEAFYNALLTKVNGAFPTIGDVFKLTKNNSMSGVSNRNFSLLGDPSMTLALPNNIVHISEIKTALGSDTLKALSKVIVKGEIRDPNNEKLNDFNGIVEATLFDKETKLVTIGRNDPPFEYNEWENALFRGKASVNNGEFEIQFIVPKNIAYQVANGKLSLYAYDSVSYSDANGFYSDFKIGESEAMIGDNEGPEIDLYISDTTFPSTGGGVVSPDTRLIANLRDESGINISNYGLGNGLIAVLDGGPVQYSLNDYYTADTDDYTSGWINFPINDLEPGRHVLTVKAWDVNNNSSQASIEFEVTGEELRVETFGTYPNPFVQKSMLFFTHNRSGDELQAQVLIQKSTGEIVGTAEISIPESSYRVDLLEINAGNLGDKKLAPGLYLARLIVRSLTNGSKNEQVTKLIILN
jgi:hypothetical protein